jgi:hypothetical protein
VRGHRVLADRPRRLRRSEGPGTYRKATFRANKKFNPELTGPKDDMSRIFLSQSHLDARETLAIRGHHQDTLGLSEDTRRLAE